ncbi:ANTAR domain-containing response regulator [Actibacterium ureilyticum]|uniref:ANTAR domain-containing response regulator n=1 Tax=Actibacterium ureilyticum TaxID=1590614 RepID=UPI000BAAD145|nr:ANTAR domain-containing protein [Actibacterium ureilyticum]
MMFLQLKDPCPLSAVLIDPNEARAEMFDLMLGHRDIALSDRVATVDRALALSAQPALFLIYVEMVDQAAIADLRRLRGARDTAILVLLESAARRDIETLLDNGAHHVLPLGLDADRFSLATITAVAQAGQQRRLERDADAARAEVATTKSIARAKMILIARHAIDEDEAHRRIQKLSMQRNLPLADMARQIIDAEELLC